MRVLGVGEGLGTRYCSVGESEGGDLGESESGWVMRNVGRRGTFEKLGRFW